MPVTKTNQYSVETKQLANFGRALGHPARVRIYEVLKEQTYTKNIDLTKVLQLSKTSVHNHLKKMLEADLIKIEYVPNYFQVSLNQGTIENWEAFMNRD